MFCIIRFKKILFILSMVSAEYLDKILGDINEGFIYNLYYILYCVKFYIILCYIIIYMNHNHLQIDKLKQNFKNIMKLSTDISKIKLRVNTKLEKMKELYNNIVKFNNTKIFLFCLDSFHFQYKNFVIEAENIDKVRLLTNNRMYCDYYKLYNIIIKFVKEQKKELDLQDLDNSYPIYKDLEPFLEYKSHDIKSVHNNILDIIHLLYNEIESSHNNITHYNDNNKMGFTLSNFLNTLEYENKLLQEQIELYVNYICFFQISQKKQLTSIYSKLLEFDKAIADNVNINKSYSIDDIIVDEIITEEDEAILSILNQDKEEAASQDPITSEIEHVINDDKTNIVDPIPEDITKLDPIPAEMITAENNKATTSEPTQKPKRKKATMIM